MARHWTEYENLWLEQVWPKTEIPREAMAHALKRTVVAVRSRAQKLGVKRAWNGSPENLRQFEKARRIAQKTWNGSAEQIEHLRQLNETWNGSAEQIEHLKRLHKTWIGSPKHIKTLKRLCETWSGSPENLESLKLARKKAGAKPTWPEAVFYGLVFGHDGLAEEFHAQELIPTSVCNHTVDGQWRDVIFELDGGGHNAFIDRTKHDHLIDAEYRAMGYQMVRAESSSDLFLRFLQVVEERENPGKPYILT